MTDRIGSAAGADRVDGRAVPGLGDGITVVTGGVEPGLFGVEDLG